MKVRNYHLPLVPIFYFYPCVMLGASIVSSPVIFGFHRGRDWENHFFYFCIGVANRAIKGGCCGMFNAKWMRAILYFRHFICSLTMTETIVFNSNWCYCKQFINDRNNRWV